MEKCLSFYIMVTMDVYFVYSMSFPSGAAYTLVIRTQMDCLIAKPWMGISAEKSSRIEQS